MIESEDTLKLFTTDAYDEIIKHRKIKRFGFGVAYCLGLPGYYFAAYQNHPIRYIAVRFGNLDTRTYQSAPADIKVFFSDGKIGEWKTKYIDSYITQFGIAVSEDGKYVFAQTWENGLFCYNSMTGEKIWRTRSRAGITNVHINHKTICAFQHEKALQLIDIDTGTVISEKRPAAAWGFFSIDETHFLCHTTSRKWEVVESDTLETSFSFPDSDEKTKKEFAIRYSIMI